MRASDMVGFVVVVGGGGEEAFYLFGCVVVM